LKTEKHCNREKNENDGNPVSQNPVSNEIPKSEAKNLMHVVVYVGANVKNQKLLSVFNFKALSKK
jgi:hypothetical protein